MSALINQHPHFDVEFSVLNDLAKRLRTAGAKFSVRKMASKHRITVVKEPTIVTVEQILIYAMGKDNIDTPNMPSNDVAIASNPAHKEETTDTPNPQELAVLPESAVPEESVAAPQDLATRAELLSLPLEKLKALAKHHKVTGFSKIKLEKLAAKLQGLVTKEQLA